MKRDLYRFAKARAEAKPRKYKQIKLTKKAFQELQTRQAKGELLEYSDISNLIQLKAKLDNPGDDIVIGAPVNPGDNPGGGLQTPKLPTAY